MKRSRIWIWFFVVLLILTCAAATIEIWFNLSQQLNTEQVAQAQALWREKAPAAYELEFAMSRQARPSLHYRATIRDREVTAIRLNDQEIEPVLYPLHDLPPLIEKVAAWLTDDPSRTDGEVDWIVEGNPTVNYQVKVQPGQAEVTRNGQATPARLTEVYLPTAQLAAIARQLEIDLQPDAGRLFKVASFDRQNGMPLRYVRSVTATRERVQFAVMDRKMP